MSAHGTIRSYNTGCRCADCKQARREIATSHRRRQRGPDATPVPPHMHGTTTGYNYYACHCERCRFAEAKYKQWRKTGRVT